MKILGAIIYLIGILGIGYIITETRIDFTESFGTLLVFLLWCILTFGIGTALMNAGNKSGKDNDG